MPEGKVGKKTGFNHPENVREGKYQIYSAGAGKQYSYK